MSTGKWKLARHNFSLQDGGNLQGIFHVYRKWKLARQHSCFVAVQVQWDRTMRRVIMMEADVSDGSTPLLDTFADIAEGQNKVTVAQVKVCSTSQRLPAGVHCTAAIIDLSATMIRIRLIIIAWPAATFTILIIEGEY